MITIVRRFNHLQMPQNLSQNTSPWSELGKSPTVHIHHIKTQSDPPEVGTKVVEPTTGTTGVVGEADGLSGVATGKIASALSQESCRALETA